MEPFISKTTISTHFNKHHHGYVKKLNAAVSADEGLKGSSVIDFIVKPQDYNQKIVNLASQIYNHEFYWECINPTNNGNKGKSYDNPPTGISTKLYDFIIKEFNDFDNLKKEFTTRAKKHFGSGWIWLVIDKDNKLQISDGHDADCPLSFGDTPLLNIDVWYVTIIINYIFYIFIIDNKIYLGNMHIIWIIKMKEQDMLMSILIELIGNLYQTYLNKYQTSKNCNFIVSLSGHIL